MGTSQSLLISLIVILQLTQGSRANNEADLITKLLIGYDINARPVLNQSNPVLVKFGLVLQQIIHLDERQQQLQIKVWIRYQWRDESLQWNSSAESGIKHLRILPIRIWRPDITLYDNLAEDPSDNNAKLFPAKVSNDGTVSWNIPKIINSNCDVDVSYYPWDEQKCILKFGSWTYDGAALDIVNKTAAGDLTYYTTSSEWNIISFDVERHNILYNCCPNPYPDVTFIIHIRRKPMYYLFNLILPAVFITITTVLVFYLPPESGEKVSLGVTVLLALTVFLLLVAESVPKSETVPLIGKYFEATIMLMALSSALTVITLNIHHRGMYGNEVPLWIRVVVLDWLARPLCLKAKVDANLSENYKTSGCCGWTGVSHALEKGIMEDGVKHQVEMVTSEMPINSKQQTGDPTLLAILDVQKRFQKAKREEDYGEACKTDWMLVAAVIDRFLLYLFFILTIITTCVILTEHPSYKETPIA